MMLEHQHYKAAARSFGASRTSSAHQAISRGLIVFTDRRSPVRRERVSMTLASSPRMRLSLAGRFLLGSSPNLARISEMALHFVVEQPQPFGDNSPCRSLFVRRGHGMPPFCSREGPPWKVSAEPYTRFRVTRRFDGPLCRFTVKGSSCTRLTCFWPARPSASPWLNFLAIQQTGKRG